MRKTKRTLALLLAIIMIFSSMPFSAVAAPIDNFTDTDDGAWYAPAVKYALENKLFSGTTATTFSPYTVMTRGMFVTVLARMAGYDKSDYYGIEFADFKENAYFAPAVQWALYNGISTGTSIDRFSPDSKITREQVAKMLYSFADITGNDTTCNSTSSNMNDMNSVSSWAKSEVLWAIDKKIIKGAPAGNGKNNINPKGGATRAEVAQMFYNLKGVFSSTSLINENIVKPLPKPDRDYLSDQWTYESPYYGQDDWYEKENEIVEKEMLRLVNEERKLFGLSELVLEKGLSEINRIRRDTNIFYKEKPDYYLRFGSFPDVPAVVAYATPEPGTFYRGHNEISEGLDLINGIRFGSDFNPEKLAKFLFDRAKANPINYRYYLKPEWKYYSFCWGWHKFDTLTCEHFAR